ncbi:DUF1795 domain-containing protein [Paraburkholderia xenovorans]|uniref:DUF1795 domain-containing protein n=1 Tax=Paraburkholderia xenovorans TaxID=36873 RepID=UPI0038BD7993
MRYLMNEGYLDLPGNWHDRTVHALLPAIPEVTGSNLVLTRDDLPYGSEFADYVDVQKSRFRRELTDLQMQYDAPCRVDERPGHSLAFTWRRDGLPVHHLALIILDAPTVLTLTYTSPGQLPPQVRRDIVAALSGFRFHRRENTPA